MNNDVEIVKSRINIIDIVAEKVRLKKAAANYFGLCPFHSEKTPSFSVNENIQLFKCFGCGEHGDVITFVMKTENMEFRDALEFLAEKVGYKLNSKADVSTSKDKQLEEKLYKVNDFVVKWFQKRLMAGENEGMKYAVKRGLSNELIHRFGVGYAGPEKSLLSELLIKKGLSQKELELFGISVQKENGLIDKFRNRLIFGINDERGRVVGFTGRYLGKDEVNFKPPKYLNSPETPVFKKSHLLFGLYQARQLINKLNFVIVTEGQMNVISSHKCGVENIVASSGTSFTEDHLKILSRYTSNIYLAFDKDVAGKKALLRTLELLFRHDLTSKVIHWDPERGKDPDEIINVNSHLWIDAVKNPIDPIEFIFNEFSNKYGLEDFDKVNSFLKTILQLLSFHTNEVKKEFYLKMLSEKLEIPVSAFKDSSRLTLFRKNSASVQSSQEKINDGKERKVFKLTTFDKVFALILQNWLEVRYLLLGLDREYMPDEHKEMYDCLTIFVDENDLTTLRENVDESVRESLDNLLLNNIVLDSSISIEEHVTKLIEQSKNEYKRYLVMEWKKNPEDAGLLDKINKVLGKTN